MRVEVRCDLNVRVAQDFRYCFDVHALSVHERSAFVAEVMDMTIKGLALSAQSALERMTDDDSRRVSAAATAVVKAYIEVKADVAGVS